MKKVILLLVGIMAIGMYTITHVKAAEENILETEAIVDGEASDELFEETSNRQRLGRTTGNRTVELKRFYIEVTDGAASSVAVSMPNTKLSISYSYNDKGVQIHEGTTNNLGEITNLTFKEIPNEVTTLKIRYHLGNNERGFVQKFNKNSYQFVYTLSLSTNSIDTKGAPKVRFGAQGNEDSYFYNFQAARINYYFDEAVREYVENVQMANELLPETSKFELPPINIHFEKGQFVDQNNAFFRNGHDGSKVADIVIGDKSNRIFDEVYLKHNIIHEWSHWNLTKNVGSFGGTYTNHYTYNEKPAVSYGEGWPLLVGEMYARNYDLSNRDQQVQTDKVDGVNRLFGKSTNVTVQKVLYDLLDVVSVDEGFSVSKRFLDEEMSELNQKKLNLGIMHTVMVESKATTLQDFLKYLEKNYVKTKKDKAEFAKVLEVNGLSRDGAFTLDNEGNPLTAPLQAVETQSTVDKD